MKTLTRSSTKISSSKVLNSVKKSAAKNLPKIPKAIAADARKVTVSNLIGQFKKSWSEIPKSELKESRHHITNLTQYVTEMEHEIYRKFYCMGSLDDYREKLKTIMYNIRYNSRLIFLNFSPEDLSKVDSVDLVTEATQSVYGSDGRIRYWPFKRMLAEALEKIGQTPVKTRDTYEISSALEYLQQNVLPLIFTGIQKSAIKCRTCGPDIMVYTFSKQTRSADEGMTVFAICSKCSQTWKP